MKNKKNVLKRIYETKGVTKVLLFFFQKTREIKQKGYFGNGELTWEGTQELRYIHIYEGLGWKIDNKTVLSCIYGYMKDWGGKSLSIWEYVAFPFYIKNARAGTAIGMGA